MSFVASANLQLLALWLVASPLLLAAIFGGQAGWMELGASNGPLLLWCDRRLRPVGLALAGLAGLAAYHLASSGGAFAPSSRLLVDAGVFVVGVYLTARSLERLGSDSTVASPPVDAAASEQAMLARFEARLEREIGRARRHDRSLVLVSVAQGPAASRRAGRPGAAPPSAATRTPRDDSREIARRLERALRLDSELVAARDRVLVLVPDIERGEAGALLERLRSVLEADAQGDFRLGLACFPEDALCSADLIALADRNRASGREGLASREIRLEHPAAAGKATEGAA